MKKLEEKKGAILLREKKSKKIDFRLSEDEYKSIEELAKTFGLTKAELIRNRVLDNSTPLVVNKLEMIKELNLISSELGKSGSNLNQLAHHANRMRVQGIIEPSILKRLDLFFEQHNIILKELHIALRSVIRKLSK